MRSDQVFRAREQIGNPYLLCRLTARTTRCLHFASSNTQDAIDDALTRLSQAAPETVPNPADRERRAQTAR